MIDWYNLIMNTCWISGCAVALATISYASWEASAQREKIRVWLRQPNIQIALNFGGFLFCTGLAGTSGVVWQRILWILLGIGFLVQISGKVYRK